MIAPSIRPTIVDVHQGVSSIPSADVSMRATNRVPNLACIGLHAARSPSDQGYGCRRRERHRGSARDRRIAIDDLVLVLGGQVFLPACP